MEEVEKVVITAIDDTVGQAGVQARDAAESVESREGSEGGEGGEGGKDGKGAPGKKKANRDEWFKRVVSALIAIVTIIGALVAWRASVAGNQSSENDSKGLLALQNSEETKAITDIKANGDELGYINYLRDRIISYNMLKNNVVSSFPEDMQDYVARQITETLDSGITSERYFFPGKYLTPSSDPNSIYPDYDYQRQVNEAYAQAQENKDLNYQQHFADSDALSNKSMFLLATLIVLAISLWLLALAEVISSAVKYAAAGGGFLYLLLGSISAYLVDSGTATQDDVGAFAWPAVWVLAGFTLLVAIALGVLPLVRARAPKPVTTTTTVTTTQPPPVPYVPPSGPTVPPPVQPGQQPYTPYPPYPQSGYGQAPPTGPTGYGPPPPPYQAPPPMQPSPATQPPPQGQGAVTPVAEGHTAAGATATKTVTKKEEKEEEEKPFNRIVTVMIATVALLAALTAYLQADASNQSSGASRNAQQYAIQSLGMETYGASEMSYQDQGLVQTWKRLQVLANSATNHGDTVAAQNDQEAMNHIAGLSDIFGQPYFDPNSQDVPNDYAFAADLYQTQAVGSSERATVQRTLHDIWDSKASSYIADLTLLAVSLALLGLSLATSGFIRFIFAGAGLVIMSGAVVWAIITYTQPIVTTSDQAIDDYAKGYGLEQGGNYDDAIKAFGDALSIEPGYANAYYERANTYFYQGTDAYTNAYYDDEAGNTDDANTNYQLSTSKLQAAAQDYQAARSAGRDDTSAGWNLGWTYYLLGQFDDAEQIDRYVLDKDPSVVAVRLNLGLALMAEGKYDDAQLEYNTAIARTSDQINNAHDKGQTVSADFWLYLDESASDLYNLLLQANDFGYAEIQAPPKDKIANPDEMTSEAFDTMTKLRDKTAAFEYLAQKGEMPPDSTPSVTVDTPTFEAIEQGVADPVDGDVFPPNTSSVTMYYTYTGTLTGHEVLFKIYHDYDHIPGYDKETDNWQFGDDGTGFATVNDPFQAYSESNFLDPGLWTVEMYEDYHMVQIAVFYVETQEEANMDQSATSSSP